jgi:hypothetical protein
LRRYDQSLSSYRKGVEVADRYLGPNHSITVTLRNSTVAARRAIVAKDPQARTQLATKKTKAAAGKKSKGGVRPETETLVSPRPEE